MFFDSTQLNDKADRRLLIKHLYDLHKASGENCYLEPPNSLRDSALLLVGQIYRLALSFLKHQPDYERILIVFEKLEVLASPSLGVSARDALRFELAMLIESVEKA